MAVQTVGQGGTTTLDATFEDGSGALVDPVDPRVDILDPSDVEVVSNDIPTQTSTGRYSYSYTVSPTAPLGVWTARWTGTINSVLVTDEDVFEVVAAGEITFDPTVLVTPQEATAAAGVTLTSAQLDALQALIADWTAQLEARLNRPLTVRAFTNERAVLPVGSDTLWVRNAPIQEVTAIRDTGGNSYTGAYTVSGGGIIFSGGIASVATTYYVDYTAGLATADAAPAKALVKERAARMAVKMADDAFGVNNLTQEGYNAPYLEEGWTETELENVGRLRRRVVRV